jgi:hypothetical protein
MKILNVYICYIRVCLLLFSCIVSGRLSSSNFTNVTSSVESPFRLATLLPYRVVEIHSSFIVCPTTNRWIDRLGVSLMLKIEEYLGRLGGSTNTFERELIAAPFSFPEQVMSHSTIKDLDYKGDSRSTIDWLIRGQDHCCKETVLASAPGLEEQYRLGWILMRRDEVVSAKVDKAKLDSISSPSADLVDKDILDIRDAAKILRCSVDKVRRIPKEDLAVFDGPGRANLYLREHLIEYVQQFRIEPPIDTRCMEEALNDILDQG